jgi:hypothetical protein
VILFIWYLILAYKYADRIDAQNINCYAVRNANMKKNVAVLMLAAIIIGAIIVYVVLNSPLGPTGDTSVFSVDSAGRDMTTFDGKVTFEVPAGALTTKTDISIIPAQNIAVTGYTVISAYQFHPEGTSFLKPTTLKITYDSSTLPSGVRENDLRLYTQQSSGVSELQNTAVYLINHTVFGQVSHFSLIFMGVSQSSSSANPTLAPSPTQNPESNESILYEFEVKPQFHSEVYTSPPVGEYPEVITNYYYSAYVSWNPNPYVRYYEVEFNFHGNPPPSVKPGDFRGTETPIPYPYLEGKIYTIGGALMTEVTPNYIGSASVVLPYSNVTAGKDGVCLITAQTVVSSTEKLGNIELSNIQTNMETFAQNLVRNWVVTIRPVT